MSSFQNLCCELNIPIAEDKTVGPVTVLTFLGFVTDTDKMIGVIPEEKIIKLKDYLVPMLNSKNISVKDLESVIDLLAYCSRAIPSSRAFLRRFDDLLAGLKCKKPYYLVILNHEANTDVALWIQFLADFNGQCYFPDKYWVANDVLQLFTDSSGNPNLGCGAYFAGYWVQFQWPNHWSALPMIKHMALLELVPVVLAMSVWAQLLQNKRILLRIDNSALISIINKRTSKNKQIMKLIRPLVLLNMQFNIQFKSVHIEGLHSEISDALSRFQMKRFRSLVPTAALYPMEIPQAFLDIISVL
jgi:hypothetical protein